MLIVKVGDDVDKRRKVNPEHLGAGIILKREELEAVPQYLGADLFGSIIKIRLEDWNIEEVRVVLYKYLEDMKNSPNIFIIDEADMLDTTFKKITKSATKVYDCRVSKIKDTRSFELADLIMAKIADPKANNTRKKNAWLLYQDLKKTEPIESIIGAINYKLKMSNSVAEREKKWAQNAISVALSHDSRADAHEDLERVILGL